MTLGAARSVVPLVAAASVLARGTAASEMPLAAAVSVLTLGASALAAPLVAVAPVVTLFVVATLAPTAMADNSLLAKLSQYIVKGDFHFILKLILNSI